MTRIKITGVRPVVIALAAFALASCGGSATSNGNAAQSLEAGQTPDGAQLGSQTSGCARFFVGGKPPALTDDKFKPKTRMLCFRSFAVLHSGVVRQPLWSAEMVTAAAVDLARQMTREDNFHAEERIPVGERAELKDYSRSGYDRGHLAPNGDMASREAADESFSLANIGPQAAGLNRGSWERLESSIRRQSRGGNVYVVTGPLFIGPVLATHDDGRVKVPTHDWKGIYAEGRGATIFIATNEQRPKWTTLSVNQFAKVYGIDPFPGLDPKYRDTNGTIEGSLGNPTNATEGGAAKTGQGAPGGGQGSATGGGQAVPERMVRSPLSGQYMSESAYRAQYNRNPRPEEYSN